MPGMSPRSPEAVLLRVRVRPRARANAVKGWRAGILSVSVTAAPEDGKANRAVIAVLADAFDLAPSSISLVRGAASRDKWFRLPRGVRIPA